MQSWLVTKRLKFAYTAARSIEQCAAYRYADNVKPTTGEKRKEDVFKLKDELPDAIRYALMAWPELPDSLAPAMSDAEQARWAAYDDKTRHDLTMQKEYAKKQKQGVDLVPEESGYPIKGFWQGNDDDQDGSDFGPLY
jgi:hypothetical protein